MTGVPALVAIAVVALTACGVGDDETERALPKKARTILTDNFSEQVTDWYTGDDPESAADIVDGRYRVRVKEEDWYISDSLSIDEVVEAIRVEVDAVHAEGSQDDLVGTICYAHVGAEEDAGYAFSVGPDEGWVAIYRSLEDETRTLAQREDVDAVRRGRAVNRIRADCVGATRDQPAVLVLYVNGTQVLRAEDRDGFPRFDGIGVTTDSADGATVAFYDNVVVRELR